jgi:hypothetical protein
MGIVSGNPVFNARNREMRVSVGILRAFCFLFALLAAGVALAKDWQVPADQLAQRIAGITGPGAIAVTVMNRSSLNASESEEIRRKLLSELAAYGVQQSASDQSAATVQITLSENLQNYVWVAEIRQGTGEPVVIMVSVPEPVEARTDRSSQPLIIHKSFLWAGNNRILDLAVINGTPLHLIVLEPERVGLYRQQNGVGKRSNPWLLCMFGPGRAISADG